MDNSQATPHPWQGRGPRALTERQTRYMALREDILRSIVYTAILGLFASAGALHAHSTDPFETAVGRAEVAPVAVEIQPAMRFSFETDREESLWSARDWTIVMQQGVPHDAEIALPQTLFDALLFSPARSSLPGPGRTEKLRRAAVRSLYRFRSAESAQIRSIRSTASNARTGRARSRRQPAKSASSDDGGGPGGGDPPPARSKSFSASSLIHLRRILGLEFS